MHLCIDRLLLSMSKVVRFFSSPDNALLHWRSRHDRPQQLLLLHLALHKVSLSHCWANWRPTFIHPSIHPTELVKSAFPIISSIYPLILLPSLLSFFLSIVFLSLNTLYSTCRTMWNNSKVVWGWLMKNNTNGEKEEKFSIHCTMHKV